jgi:Tfp pilus assembly protein PilN
MSGEDDARCLISRREWVSISIHSHERRLQMYIGGGVLLLILIILLIIFLL